MFKKTTLPSMVISSMASLTLRIRIFKCIASLAVLSVFILIISLCLCGLARGNAGLHDFSCFLSVFAATFRFIYSAYRRYLKYSFEVFLDDNLLWHDNDEFLIYIEKTSKQILLSDTSRINHELNKLEYFLGFAVIWVLFIAPPKVAMLGTLLSLFAAMLSAVVLTEQLPLEDERSDQDTFEEHDMSSGEEEVFEFNLEN